MIAIAGNVWTSLLSPVTSFRGPGQKPAPCRSDQGCRSGGAVTVVAASSREEPCGSGGSGSLPVGSPVLPHDPVPRVGPEHPGVAGLPWPASGCAAFRRCSLIPELSRRCRRRRSGVPCRVRLHPSLLHLSLWRVGRPWPASGRFPSLPCNLCPDYRFTQRLEVRSTASEKQEKGI